MGVNMAVEVMLMADVKDVGAEGAVVRVAEGYARNYLFPRKLAAPVTAATRRQLAKRQSVRESALKMELEQARVLVASIEKNSYTILAKVGTEDKMFGSVTAADIVEALGKQGIQVDKHKVILDKPIKELGVYDVKIRLHPEAEATMKVWIVEE